MSINHLIDSGAKPRYDIYVNNIDAQEGTILADSILAVENMKAQGRMTADTFKLGSTQEVSIGDTDVDKYKFDTNLTVETGTSPWVSISSVEGCKMTRDKLHYNPETDKFRKVFNFDVNFTLNVDYSLRAGATVAELLFNCNGFFNFVPITPLGARINKLVFYQGDFYTYDAVNPPTGVFGQIRCFTNNTPDNEGFNVTLLPVNTMPTTGTEQWTCQFSVSIMDSEEFEGSVPPP